MKTSEITKTGVNEQTPYHHITTFGKTYHQVKLPVVLSCSQQDAGP